MFVVLDDASLEKAVKTGVQARLNNAGQVCTAAKRFILHENIADQFLSQFTEAFRRENRRSAGREYDAGPALLERCAANADQTGG